MSKKRQYSKEAIDKALRYVLNKEGSVRQASKTFGVPRSSIQFKLLNPQTKFKSGPDTVLTEEEETAMCNQIIELAKRGFPLKKEDVQRDVQDFLKKNPRPNPFRDQKPGEAWFKAFLKRHPVIAVRTSEGVTNASACVSEADIRKWFQEISAYIEENDLVEVIADPTRVFNGDETGFNMCPKTGKVLAERGSKNVYQIEKGSSKDNITVMFTFSASGLVCQPMIIYPYKRIPDKVILSVPANFAIGKSEKGWMTAAVFYDFIENVFYPEILKRNISLPIILFVDGHKTHITREVSELCQRLSIHLIALYPNATRILQPADVAAFRPIKHGWKNALRDWHAENNYQKSLTKETFAPLLKTVLDTTIKTETLVNGFRVSGLYPFDANNVDYSKCLPSHNKDKASEIEKDHNDSYKLNFEEFSDTVGLSIIRHCEDYNNNSPISCEHFKAIHNIWKKFKGLEETNEIVPYSHQIPTEEVNNDQPTNYSDSDIVTKEIVSDLILDECTGEMILDEHTSLDDETGLANFVKISTVAEIHSNTLNEDSIVQNKDPMFMKHIHTSLEEREESCIVEEFNTNFNISENNNTYFERQETKEFETRNQATEVEKTVNIQTETQDTEKYILREKTEEIVRNQETGQKNRLTSEISHEKKLELREIQPSNNKQNVIIISNESFSDYLTKKMTPAAPKRQGKRQTEKVPFALTSDVYIEMIKAKELKKLEDEAAKENRKRLREEKKKEKEMKPKVPKKPKVSSKEKTKTTKKTETVTSSNQLSSKVSLNCDVPVCCDSCLNPITRRIMKCSTCLKQFHVNCIPSSHRDHIPEDKDDEFLCHRCFHVSNTDSSEGDNDVIEMFNSIAQEASKQGF